MGLCPAIRSDQEPATTRDPTARRGPRDLSPLGSRSRNPRSPMDPSLQANTERRRNVLSTVFLGRELLRNQRLILTYDELVNSLEWLARLLEKQGSLA